MPRTTPRSTCASWPLLPETVKRAFGGASPSSRSSASPIASARICFARSRESSSIMRRELLGLDRLRRRAPALVAVRGRERHAPPGPAAGRRSRGARPGRDRSARARGSDSCRPRAGSPGGARRGSGRARALPLAPDDRPGRPRARRSPATSATGGFALRLRLDRELDLELRMLERARPARAWARRRSRWRAGRRGRSSSSSTVVCVGRTDDRLLEPPARFASREHHVRRPASAASRARPTPASKRRIRFSRRSSRDFVSAFTAMPDTA